MLSICLFLETFELRYGYKLYAYKKSVPYTDAFATFLSC